MHKHRIIYMKYLHIIFYLITLCAVILSTSCVSNPYPHGEVPEGFALIQEDAFETGYWTSISPEGVKYRLRVVENKPLQSLDFWSRSLTAEMTRRGFINKGTPFLLDEESIWGAEWVVPQGSEDYLFLTALKVEGGNILIAEAAGPTNIFMEYRQDILDALEKAEVVEK